MGSERYDPNKTLSQFGPYSQQHQDALRHQRDQAERAQTHNAWSSFADSQQPKPTYTSWGSSSGGGSTQKKVICTELMRQGLYNRADYLLGARYVQEHLTETHVNGYHAWGLMVVRKMRKSDRWTRVFRYLATARADHIAHVYGDETRKNRFGALLCFVGERACFVIGKFSGSQDWQALYSASAKDEIA